MLCTKEFDMNQQIYIKEHLPKLKKLLILTTNDDNIFWPDFVSMHYVSNVCGLGLGSINLQNVPIHGQLKIFGAFCRVKCKRIRVGKFLTIDGLNHGLNRHVKNLYI